MNSVRTEIIKVTPTLATDWLGRNVRNRHIRPHDVAKYARDMVAGRWTFTGEAIKFSDTGVLLDGQHRLRAVIDSGHSVEMLVIWGLPDSSQHVMDTGAKRTTADALSLANVKNASMCAAGARLALIWETGILFRDNRLHNAVTTSEIEGWLEKHPEFHHSVHRIASIKSKVDCSPTALIVAHWRTYEISPFECEQFFQSLATLENLGSGNPILALHKRLADIRRGQITTTPRDYLALLITTWNRWREGKVISKLQKPHGARWTAGNFPEPR